MRRISRAGWTRSRTRRTSRRWRPRSRPMPRPTGMPRSPSRRATTTSRGRSSTPPPTRRCVPALQAAYQALFAEPGLTGIAEGSGRVDIAIMNIIGFDASAIGNHEFDLGSDAVASHHRGGGASGPTASADIQHLGAQFPYLSSNLDFSADADLADLFTADILPNTDFALSPADALAGRRPVQDRPGDDHRGGRRADRRGRGDHAAPGDDLLALRHGGDHRRAERHGGAGGGAAAGHRRPDRRGGQRRRTGDDVNKVVPRQPPAGHQPRAGARRRCSRASTSSSPAGRTRCSPTRPTRSAPATWPPATTRSRRTNADGDPVLIVSTDGEYTYVGRLVVEFDDAGVLHELRRRIRARRSSGVRRLRHRRGGGAPR